MHQSGDRLGPYEVTGVLGKGGMGEVYRGLDTRLNRPVALKVSDEHFTDRFNTEARAISSLNHPHVCTLYDVGPNYLVMELLEGPTLAARLQGGALPIGEVLRFGAQIAGALVAAHAKGIIHRDLKPSNVSLTTTGVKVLDFGIAKLSGPSSETKTATQGIIGTAAYMSPEQLTGGTVDARSDIYSLGIVLHEMATGIRPSAGQPLNPNLTAISDRLAHIVERCLASDPDDRWQSAGDVRHELEWTARAPTTATAAPGQRRYRWMAIASVLVVAIAALGYRPLQSLLAPAPETAALESRTSIPMPAGLHLDPSAPLAVSPDAALIAFTAINDEDVRSLYVRPLAATTATELKDTAGAAHPFFSPDGKAIGYFANGFLYRVAVDGGAPLRICPLPGTDHGGTWGDNDTIVAAIRGRGLFKTGANGGTLELIAEDLRGAWPSFLPDGKTILYTAFPGQSPRTVSLSILSLDGTVRRDIAKLSDEDGSGAPVLGSAAEIQQAVMLPQGYLVYGQDPGFIRALAIDPRTLTPRGTARTLGDQVERGAGSGGIAFAAAKNGLLVFAPTGNEHALVWVTSEGRVTPLGLDRGAYRGPVLSPDAKTIAVSANNETRRPDLWVIDVARGTRSMIRTEALSPRWTPNGRRIAFNSGLGIALTSPDGRESEILVSDDEARNMMRLSGAPYPTSWSPDGRSLLMHTGASGKTWRLRYPEKVLEPFLNGPSTESQAAISRDGRSVAFVTNESGRPEVYVARWPGLEGRAIVSTKGGSYPRWSLDSSELYYWQGRTLMAARLNASQEPQIPRALFTGDYFGTARDRSFDVVGNGRFLMVKSDERAQLAQIAVVQNWIGGAQR